MVGRSFTAREASTITPPILRRTVKELRITSSTATAGHCAIHHTSAPPLMLTNNPSERRVGRRRHYVVPLRQPSSELRACKHGQEPLKATPPRAGARSHRARPLERRGSWERAGISRNCSAQWQLLTLAAAPVRRWHHGGGGAVVWPGGSMAARRR